MSNLEYTESDYQKILDNLIQLIKNANQDKILNDKDKFFFLIGELVDVQNELDYLKNILIYQMLYYLLSHENTLKIICEEIKPEHLKNIIKSTLSVKIDFKINECECRICDYKKSSSIKYAICTYCKKELPCATEDTQYYCTHETPHINIIQESNISEPKFILFCSKKCILNSATNDV